MAVRSRSGTDGLGVALGKQTKLGTPVLVRTGMLPLLFPVSAIDLDENSDTEENNLVTPSGVAQIPNIAQLWADGGLTTRILPEVFFNLLEGILNPVKNASVALVGNTAAIAGKIEGTSPRVWTPNGAGRPTAGTGTGAAPAGWPSKLRISGLTGATAGKIVIKGQRRAGRKDSDSDRLGTFYQAEEQAATASVTFPVTSTKLWDTVSEVEIHGATGTPEFHWIPDTYMTTVTFQATDPQHPGFTVLPLKGGIPNRVWDWVMSEMLVSASSTGIDVTFNGIGSRYDEFRTVSDAASAEEPKYALEDADTTYYKRPSLESMPGWAGALLFGDAVVKYTAIDIAINRNLEADSGIDGRKFRTGADATEGRLVTFSPTSYLRAGDADDDFPRFQEMFRNQERAKLTMRNLSYDADGRQQQIDWVCPHAGLNSVPRTSASGPGKIERPLVFQAGEGEGDAQQMTVTMYTKKQLYTA